MNGDAHKNPDKPTTTPAGASVDAKPDVPAKPGTRERGGPSGPEPTRFGDWEKGGRAIDF
jgi:hypothetical protein